MAGTISLPETDEETVREETPSATPSPDLPWLVIVWDDPINTMTYVIFVFQKLFGYPRAKARKLMLDVHTKGKAVVSHGTKEKAEHDVSRLHAHGLWATMQKDQSG